MSTDGPVQGLLAPGLAHAASLGATFVDTVLDVAPILAVVIGFQVLVLRQPVPHLRQVLLGIGLVIVGLSLFLEGLEQALFPLGRLMAEQLTAQMAEPLSGAGGTESLPWAALAGHGPGTAPAPVETAPTPWWRYGWVYGFAAAIGFATTIAEPALLAVAIKANEVSGGAVGAWGLRVAVALGVAFGISLGTLRIVLGLPIEHFIIAGYVVVLVQTVFAPRAMVALAYDSGGVTTSTVTVPIVTALGLGLAEQVPGRSPLVDGFGLIAFASLFPVMAVLAYAQLSELRGSRAGEDA